MVIPAGPEQSRRFKEVDCPTGPKPHIDFIAENSALTNPYLEKENAATSAKVSGAEDVMKGVCSFSKYIALFPILATHWGALV